MSTKLIDTGIKAFNSLGAEIQPIYREEGKPLRCYTCGPTVYSTSHLGHARTYMALDMIRRIMTDYFNIPVQWSMNVTDVDDKIIKGFNDLSEQKKSRYGDPSMELRDRVQAYAREREEAFFTELDTLNVRRPDAVLRVTEVIPEIIKFIQEIIDNGFAYQGTDNSVYFDVDKYEADPRFVYAELERTSFNAAGAGPEAGADPEGKRSRNDFALWKAAKEGEPYWESPWGRGRPGWHIECSTMSTLLYGTQFDIHCGGIDLRFPHHTNEIAQSQARSGVTPWVKMWLHTGQLRVGGEKMSKSTGNFWSIKDGLAKYDPQLIRMFFCQTQWQQVTELNDDKIEQARAELTRIKNFLQAAEVKVKTPLSQLKRGYTPDDTKFEEIITKTQQLITESFANNFDIPSAFMAVKQLIDAYYVTKDKILDSLAVSAAHLVRRFLDVLGFAPETVLLKDTTQGFNPTPLAESMAKYRAATRKTSLDLLKNAKELNKKLASADDETKQLLTSILNGVKEELSLLDGLRDDALPSLGIKLEDAGDGSVEFKLGDPKEFEEMKRQKEAIKKMKEQQKALQKQAQNAPNKNAGRTPKKTVLPKPIKDGKPMEPSEYFRSLTDFYSEWDERGFPTLDHEGQPLSKNAKKKLEKEWQKIEKDYNDWKAQQN